jgi:hypothetical protein
MFTRNVPSAHLAQVVPLSLLEPSHVTFPSLSLQNSIKAIEYSYINSGSAQSTNIDICALWSQLVAGDIGRVTIPQSGESL